MKKTVARFYSFYGMILFVLTAIVFMLPQLLLAQRRKWHKLALRINHYWARCYFFLYFIKVRITQKTSLDPNGKYIICANHFSYLDVPSMPLVPLPFKFIGKSTVAKVPAFGYMFRKIHVPVDREKLNSRAMSLKQAMQEIEEGFNMMFFPEGGVITTDPPKMVLFRDGAFRLAVNFQLPVLPIVLHDNYKILPDDGRFLLYRHPMRITILEPVFPTSTDESEIQRLREIVFSRIQEELLENQ